MNAPDPRRREELHDLAEHLAGRLRSAEVPALDDRSEITRGVSASVLAHATSYLGRVRDAGRFRDFLARIDQLDPITAQNPDNPKADHRVLREQLEAFLTDHADLTADELLYVLAWARRLLPRPVGSNGGRRPDRDRGGREGGGSRRRPGNGGGGGGDAPIRGGQLAAALAKAQRETRKRKS